MADRSEEWSARLESRSHDGFAFGGIVKSESDIKALISESNCRPADHRIRAASAKSSPIGGRCVRHWANRCNQAEGAAALKI